jgi:hypothetical protein
LLLIPFLISMHKKFITKERELAIDIDMSKEIPIFSMSYEAGNDDIKNTGTKNNKIANKNINSTNN